MWCKCSIITKLNNAGDLGDNGAAEDLIVAGFDVSGRVLSGVCLYEMKKYFNIIELNVFQHIFNSFCLVELWQAILDWSNILISPNISWIYEISTFIDLFIVWVLVSCEGDHAMAGVNIVIFGQKSADVQCQVNIYKMNGYIVIIKLIWQYHIRQEVGNQKKI